MTDNSCSGVDVTCQGTISIASCNVIENIFYVISQELVKVLDALVLKDGVATSVVQVSTGNSLLNVCQLMYL